MAEARIFAAHNSTDFGGFALTGADGSFAIEDLPLGGYSVSVERVGFATRTFDVELGAGHGRSLNVVMKRGAALAARPAIASSHANYSTVTVFYATDRDEGAPGQYGSRRGSLVFGTVDVSIPRNHRMGRLEAPTIWKLEFRENPQKHVSVLGVTPRSRDEFLGELRATIDRAQAKSALVFFHGFNVTFEDAARRTAQIAYDLGFDGAPAMYSWPSNGRLVDYVADTENSTWSVPHAQEFLGMLAEQSGAKTVHLIAHSMGNRVLTSALVGRLASGASAKAPHFEQIALVAPDIDADVFTRDIVPKIVPGARRVTLYASSRDRALLAAKRLRAGYPRAGDLSDGVVVLSGVDTIDVSAVDTNLVGHSYYADNESVISDLFYLVRQGLPPSSRFRLLPELFNGQRYWRFAP